MSKDMRGTKRHCESCGKKFYDLGKAPEICPLCDAPYVAEKPKAKPAAKAPAKAPVEKVPEEKEEVAAVVETPSDNKPEFVSLDDAAAEESSDEDDDDELAALTDDDDDDIPDDDAEDVFLEDDEDEPGSDVKGIIGGPIDPKDEA